MRFLMMYKPDRAIESCGPATPEGAEKMGRYLEEMTRTGTLLASEALQPSTMGARVRLKDHRYAVTDGPFAEAKELIAGFAIVEAGSREEAIAMAQQFLEIAGDGETEIRLLMERPAVTV